GGVTTSADVELGETGAHQHVLVLRVGAGGEEVPALVQRAQEVAVQRRLQGGADGGVGAGVGEGRTDVPGCEEADGREHDGGEAADAGRRHGVSDLRGGRGDA